MSTLALMLAPTTDGWGVYLSNGRELARYRGIGSRYRAIRYLRRLTRTPERATRRALLTEDMR